MKSAVRHKKVKANDNVGEMGVVTFTTYEIDSPRAIEIDQELKDAVLMPPERYHALKAELARICKVKNTVKHNMCVKVGRSIVAARLGGDTTYTGIINYGAAGTSTTAVADSDTQLGAEVKRKAIATRTVVGDQVNLEVYFSKGDVSGTLQEFGLFIDGTTTANTGVMFNRLLTGGWSKSSAEALTASIQININKA